MLNEAPQPPMSHVSNLQGFILPQKLSLVKLHFTACQMKNCDNHIQQPQCAISITVSSLRTYVPHLAQAPLAPENIK
jgi:hypothetical protein